MIGNGTSNGNTKNEVLQKKVHLLDANVLQAQLVCSYDERMMV